MSLLLAIMFFPLILVAVAVAYAAVLAWFVLRVSFLLVVWAVKAVSYEQPQGASPA